MKNEDTTIHCIFLTISYQKSEHLEYSSNNFMLRDGVYL